MPESKGAKPMQNKEDAVALKGHLARSKRGREGHSVEGPVPQETVTPDPLEVAFSLLCCSWSGGGSGTSGWDPDGAAIRASVNNIASQLCSGSTWSPEIQKGSTFELGLLADTPLNGESNTLALAPKRLQIEVSRWWGYVCANASSKQGLSPRLACLTPLSLRTNILDRIRRLISLQANSCIHTRPYRGWEMPGQRLQVWAGQKLWVPLNLARCWPCLQPQGAYDGAFPGHPGRCSWTPGCCPQSQSLWTALCLMSCRDLDSRQTVSA